MSLEKNSLVQAYLATVTSHIRSREVHAQVKTELLSHAEEIVLELKNEGVAEQDAVSAALHRLGGADELGRQLQQTHQPQKNWPLVVAVACLSSFGMLIMYWIETSGSVIFVQNLLAKNSIYTCLGSVVLSGLYFVDFWQVRRYGLPLYGGTILLWMVAILWGTPINASFFLVVGSLAINYTNITPYLLAVALAGILANADWSNHRFMLKMLGLFAIPLMISAWSCDLSLLITQAVLFLSLIILTGAGGKQIAGLILLSMGMVAIFSMDQIFGGMMDVQSVANPHTDHVLLYSMQKWGWPAGFMIFFTEIAFLLILARSTLQIKDSFARLTAGGISACFTVQFVGSMGMQLGLLPSGPMNLPFVSFGGSQTMIHLVAIGVVLSLYKHKNLMNFSD